MRAVMVAVGTLAIGFGGWSLLSTQDLAQVAQTVLWAGAAVVAHDLLLVPVVLALGWLVRRRSGARVAAVAAAALVLLGPVSLAAVPVLLADGVDRQSGMATLLDRDYLLGWAALAFGTVVTAAVLARSRILSGQERGRSTGGTDPRGR